MSKFHTQINRLSKSQQSKIHNAIRNKQSIKFLTQYLHYNKISPFKLSIQTICDIIMQS